jgi:cobalt/nickel transport system permease protein
VALATAVVGAAGFAYGVRRLEGRLRDRTTVLMGMMAAFIFAAQMVNFPLIVLPASGHLIGATLATVLLGPWAGAIVIGLVLLVQCLLFGDGALTALGANFVNLGLVASLASWVVYDPIRRAVGGRGGVLLGAMAAAWVSVPLSALAFSVELAASGKWADLPRILGWMTLVHAAIGLGEALITGLVVRYILLVRPDLILDSEQAPGVVGGFGRVAAGGLVAALAVAAFLSPFASPLSDGLEFVGEKFGFVNPEVPASFAAPIPDYAVAGIPSEGLATALAGLVGTVVVFVAGLLMARIFARKPRLAEVETHAAGA